MWLAGWAVRVLLLITAPLYYLCRFVAEAMSGLDEWSWRAIHGTGFKKPPQSETAQPQPQPSAKRFLR
ncbi:MAG TPA: hypothetical protein VMT05_02160 [Terriglobales bacterium]|nr:hypothetical protein [Terriglobales bacterium]